VLLRKSCAPPWAPVGDANGLATGCGGNVTVTLRDSTDGGDTMDCGDPAQVEAMSKECGGNFSGGSAEA